MLNLKNKTAKQKAKIKSQELAKVKLSKFKKGYFDIEIIGDIKEIEVSGSNGIELFATAYKNGKQCGFGEDGSIEIERFRFFNPPVLVDDENGEIVREWIDEETKETKQRKLKYDPAEAIKQSLTHTILQVVKDNKNIVKGKIGNTTSTFYPSLDGCLQSGNSSWSTARNASTATAWDGWLAVELTKTEDRSICKSSPMGLTRPFLYFDTSAIDTDDVDSAVLSFYVRANNSGGTSNVYVAIIGATPASDTALVAGDFDQVTDTEISGQYALTTSYTTPNTYVDFTFNSTGEGLIDKTGYSIFSPRTSLDINESQPSGDKYMIYRSSDYEGTSTDPKLVVVHSASSSIKSINGLAKASIKSRNSLAIGSIKSINGLS